MVLSSDNEGLVGLYAKLDWENGAGFNAFKIVRKLPDNRYLTQQISGQGSIGAPVDEETLLSPLCELFFTAEDLFEYGTHLSKRIRD
jgi:hypothetical protein